ncbi:hypothetical protein [Rhodobacter maris]|uniref:Tetratricopeptide repeat protein n=1 Tax=Rhodobacter maris TaxID=446682 RepID=A0A285RGC1_9RHOB|nr:hypothetical protein [Rhodobacter maris]SOB93156.1 hypothetical protein SAMN05877831_101125 [Rhodobacter maris]
MPGRLRLRSAALAGLLALVAPPLPAQEALSPAQARALALAAHRAKDGPLASGLARALLQRDPEDTVARMILAAAEYASGDFAAAGANARRAYRDAPRGPARHDAAMIAAESAFKRAQIGAARGWLRRAAYFAPDAAHQSLALRALHGLEPMQKLRWSLSFSVRPVSNINGGTLTESINFGPYTLPMPAELQALSGLQTRLGADLSYRFAETARSQWTLAAGLDGTVNRLSGSAKERAPGVNGSDYDFWTLNTALIYRGLPEGWRAPWEGWVSARHDTYGGAALTNRLGLGLAKDFRLAPRDALRAEVGVERQHRLDAPERSGTAQSLGLSYAHAGAPGRLRLSGQAIQMLSSAEASAYTGGRIGFGYDLARPLFGTAFRFDLGLEARDYDTGREDRKLDLGVSAVLPRVQYMGFAPEIGASYSRNRSNHLLYDSREFGLTLGVKSVF